MSKKNIYNIIDGAKGYREDSDKYRLRNSCLKLEIPISKNKVIVVADDDMFAPTGVYTINTRNNEIISEKRYSICPQTILLKKKYDNLILNLHRGVVPTWVNEDNRFEK